MHRKSLLPSMSLLPVVLLLSTGCPDWSREPLARVECPPRCAGVGESLSFRGDASIDPSGSALTYLYSFGDGLTAQGPNADHVFKAPGTYRVQLKVCNGKGYTDTSSCIVSVGDMPSGTGTLDDLDFQPAWYDNRVLEGGEAPRQGGRFNGFFIAPRDAVPDGLTINGEIYDPEQLPAGIEWCETVPAHLKAGEPGIVRCQSNQSRFQAGATVSLAVQEGGTILWSHEGVLPSPTLQPAYITTDKEGAELRIYVRNDSAGVLTVTGLALDGRDISEFALIDAPQLSPGSTTAIRVPFCEGFRDYHAWKVFTVFGRDAEEGIRVTRALRLSEPRFFIGNWNASSGDVFLDPEQHLVPLLEAGIDTFLWDPGGPVSPEQAFATAEAYGIHLWSHMGELNGNQLDVIRAWGDHPRWVLNAVKGEGDSEDPAIPLAKLRTHREFWPHQRLWIYNNVSFRFPTWGGMADFSGMDHYCVWAAKTNLNWPPFYWDRIEFAGRYAEGIRRNAEPGPVWFWNQSIWNDFDIGGDQIRCTTADEIRSQWYQLLAHGGKSIFWFYLRQGWIDDCSDPAAVEEHRRLAAEARAVEDVLLEGYSTLPGRSWATTRCLDIHVNTVTSPEAMLVILTNLDYQLKLIAPYLWNPKENVAVTLRPPAGFEPAEFWLIQGQEKVRLEGGKTGPNTWEFTLPLLPVAEMIQVLPEP